ncbi:type II secretion system minor pseudopilin GspI [Kangiella sp. TOML190]|uniref:type II secretion system minor pseudopilin GspI n=1 Tax=Kangiella sp. TOML190 TaxID=2931351 RepID=UPI00203F3729|nr:type II secretion system minor pseudopilin GspI [Kangiella sp. TOML190]
MKTGINSTKQQGLSLLELLIAMAIIGILIAPMVFNVFNSSSKNLAANREMTLASYIAQNHIAELQLAEKWPSTGTKEGEVEFAERSWKWRQEVVDTGDPNMRRVLVTILFGKDGSFSMTGFVGKPKDKQAG